MRYLSELDGVSGAEGPVRAWIRERVEAKPPPGSWRMETDALGNLLVRVGEEKPGPRLMVAAHMDEVGLMVTSVEDDGLLHFRPVGGIDPRILPAQVVRIGERRVPGVVGGKPIHLQQPEERKKAYRLEELYLDIGARSRNEAEAVVSLGDRVVFERPFEVFGEGRVMGKALDDRAGCLMLLELLREEWPGPFLAAFTVQEEVGLRGAQVAAYRLEPDAALVLETTSCADLPDVDPARQTTRLGQGPAVTFRDRTSIADPEMVRILVREAEAARIPWQWKQGVAGGNDAGAIQTQRGGARVASLSLPCRYLHQPGGVLSLDDYQHALELARRALRAWARELPNGGDGR
ncbi:aminopeptidase [Limnochorda pilosa]|uniref:Aminopeptidase n=1 Tax=Limnochorda pilosa TaxID=1555112 RepID=A0A0K2SNX9_LIMPI|nr:aminopeptidase [Limnochorda pilosa]